MKLSRFSILVLLLVVLGAVAFGQERQKVNDRIKIVSVSAEGPVREGVKNDFTVEIEYNLDAADEATISIGFNSDDPVRFRMTTFKKVSRGTTLITLKGFATPKDWKERGDFAVNAILAPITSDSGGYKPYAGTKKVIDLQP